jgi:transposase
MEASRKDMTSEIPACPGCAERDRQLRELISRLVELESQNTALKARLDKLESASRAAKRQAAPFSKGPPKPNPKRPGRKSGEDYGTHHRRGVPPRIDQVLEAPLPDCCPDPNCRGKVKAREVVQQYQTEIPREVIYRQFNVHVGECECCHRRVQGRHPLQTSDALGAAANQIGPDAQALAVQLNKEAGLSNGKVKRFFKAAFNLDMARATPCRVMLRAAERCEPVYKVIVRRVQQSPFIVPDETGWRIGGILAWLHVAVGADATAYLVHFQRGYEAMVELIGEDYEGFLTHDGWSPYMKFICAIHQTCLGHLLRRSHELEESAVGGAVHFPRQVKAILKDALALRDQRDAGELTTQQAIELAGARARQIIELTCRPRENADNERFAKHLWNVQDCLFTFLQFEGVDATNYKAEQAIRPATANRKVWGGNRTETGAKAQSILMSVIRTTTQRGMEAVDFLSSTLKACFGKLPQLLPDTG